MNADQLQNKLRDLFEELMYACNDDDEDDQLSEIAERMDGIRRVSTYEEAGILTMDKGLVIECNDGTEFQLTLIRSK